MLGKLNYRDRPMGIACDPERVGPAFRVIRCSTRIAHRMPQCFKRLPLNIDKKDREFICGGPSNLPSIFYGEWSSRPRTISSQFHHNLFFLGEYHICEH